MGQTYHPKWHVHLWLPRSAGAIVKLMRRTHESSLFEPPRQRLRARAARLLPLRLQRTLRYVRNLRRIPNFRHPQWYTEKMNWRILDGHDPTTAWTCDKLRAQERVRELLPTMLIPRNLWAGADLTQLAQVTFPDRWVLKGNNRSGAVHLGHGTPTLAELSELTRGWLFPRESVVLGEWAYSLARPMLLLEEFLGSGEAPPDDYKFVVFDGRVELVNLHTGRFGAHDHWLFDRDWLPARTRDRERETLPPRPAELANMIAIAERIAGGFDNLRVDLYLTPDGIYFGETTYYSGGGTDNWGDRDVDRALGALWNLPLVFDKP